MSAVAVAPPAELPRWDVSVVFPGLESPEFEAGFAATIEEIDTIAERFDREIAVLGEPLDDAGVADVERFLAALNELADRVQTLENYLYAFVTTDSRNDQAQAKMSELEERGVDFAKLIVRVTAWVGALDVEALIARSGLAREHAYPLRRMVVEAAHQMSPAEEALAAELNPASGIAWAKLYDNLTSRIDVPFERDGQTESLPMSEIRNLAYHADRETRRRAYEAEVAAWSRHALPIAASLNGIKGQVLTLSPKRGWTDPLDEAIFANGIDRATLDAMRAAAQASFPDFRRYLRVKARAIGVPALAFYDLFAPVGGEAALRAWSFPDAIAFIEDQFATYSPRMRQMVTRAVAERWIDAEPRAGKVDGAYCMPLVGDESRILANYTPAFDGLRTLAHEFGHAYHNLNEAGLTPLQKQTPSTLAETASTFCETIVKEAALARAGEAERLFIIEESLQGACQVVVDITSRYLFEQRVFARRAERELSIDEFCELMRGAQLDTYGDGLDPQQLHPFMWAAKGHYYSAASYYNFPYMFGLLFGLGLYARYRDDADTFRTGYDDLLASTGRADAATLAERFGIDLRDEAFWTASLDVIRADITRFEQLVGAGIG